MRVYSIFQSIDGEVNLWYQGRLTIFIRLSGCNLDCNYCDTKYAHELESGSEMSIDEIIDAVKKFCSNKVTITGGEPLLQGKEFYELTKRLYHAGYLISVETNGSYEPIGYGVACWVVDYKLPSSGQMQDMYRKGFYKLRANDFIKFVIKNETDFLHATLFRTEAIENGCSANFAFSPVHGKLDVETLISWIDKECIKDAIVNIQLHKYVYKNEPL